MLEPIFLSTAPIRAFVFGAPATNASGFFFARGHRLFHITSRHVLIDEPSQHYPDRLEIEVHVDTRFSPLRNRVRPGVSFAQEPATREGA